MEEQKKIYYNNNNNNNDDDNDNKIIALLIILLIAIFILILIKYIIPNYSNYLTILNSKEEFKSVKKYNLGIMAIFKNEQDYMEEWLNHHISQGFNQIYLYCNDPNIKAYTYLSKYQYSQYIKLIDWVDKKNIGSQTIQRQAYSHCVKTYSHQCQFLLMLDLDEFVVHINPHLLVSDYINELKLKQNFDDIKAFKIQRYDFGSNGHITKPDGLVMKNYLLHEKTCSSFKTLANTDYIDKSKDFFGVHDYNYQSGKNGKVFNSYFGYGETGFPNSCKQNSINEIPLVINHYYTKSYQEYLKRCELWKEGGINPIGHRTDCENKFKSRDVNEVSNY
jgi:hypothetical protein